MGGRGLSPPRRHKLARVRPQSVRRRELTLPRRQRSGQVTGIGGRGLNLPRRHRAGHVIGIGGRGLSPPRRQRSGQATKCTRARTDPAAETQVRSGYRGRRPGTDSTAETQVSSEVTRVGGRGLALSRKYRSGQIGSDQVTRRDRSDVIVTVGRARTDTPNGYGRRDGSERQTL